jgi:WD40 repeat protein
MKNCRLLPIILLFGVSFAVGACNLGKDTIPTSIVVQSPTVTPPHPTSQMASTPTSAPKPSPTATHVDSDQPIVSPSGPTSTNPPFLPANLLPLSEQNATKLKPVALLTEQGASVVAFSPNSRKVAAGLFRSNQIKIWDLASGRELFDLNGHVNPRIISYLHFSPDGLRLASGAQGWEARNDSLIVWDAKSGAELQSFNGVLGAISPDWQIVALTQRQRDQQATLVLTNLTNGEETLTLQAPSDIYGVSFSPDGQHVAAKMFHVFQDLFAFWSLESGRLDLTLYDWLGFSYSPDGRFIAALVETGSGSDKGELNLFDAVTLKWIKTLAKDADALWYSYPAFSADGLILAASFENQVILWDTLTWQKLTTLPISGPSMLAFSADGRIFIISTQTGKVQLWGVEGDG